MNNGYWRITLKVNDGPAKGIFLGPEGQCRRSFEVLADYFTAWAELRMLDPDGGTVEAADLNKEQPVIGREDERFEEHDWEDLAENDWRFEDVEWID